MKENAHAFSISFRRMSYALVLDFTVGLSMNQTQTQLYPHAATLRYAFVHAQWHEDIVLQAYNGFVSEAQKLGLAATQIDVFPVAGAYEIPLHSKKLAQTGKYASIIACALVVDGGIYRHDFVASTVVDALMRVQLDTETPVFSVVLTPHHFHEAGPHYAFFSDHFVQKGAEAARACLNTAESLTKIGELKTA
ncbi:6,7-dimethyl-8-ribityllumazine synthase [Paenalcaligenes niemegkensis]|uniref:6,7-dimethyl-8-ribityllumazine synthase n=1 Tax=Paenalcaligenes niemegkensis TaxID=2895469 RepID=UPI0021512CA1|nr:6,7-dimethyl-8-ribityllumazine synthase [Paenalcaligenes niemegkensis]MCQ9615367.1 6,7-dimethyl-8-ribityllumazine synthase [Paenalcaligenes niemegkensis]